MMHRVSDEDLFSVPRRLVEAAISAMTFESQENEHWRGRRDFRIDQPIADAAELRAIIGDPPPLTPAEEAERTRLFAEWNREMAEKYPGFFVEGTDRAGD